MAPYLRILLLMLLVMPVCAQESSTEPRPEEPPPKNPADRYKIDISAECFKHIRDNAPLSWKTKGPRELGGDTDLYFEERAYEEVLIHAAKFKHEELETNARRDIPFG